MNKIDLHGPKFKKMNYFIKIKIIIMKNLQFNN